MRVHESIKSPVMVLFPTRYVDPVWVVFPFILVSPVCAKDHAIAIAPFTVDEPFTTNVFSVLPIVVHPGL